jgi:hypothetical protein
LQLHAGKQKSEMAATALFKSLRNTKSRWLCPVIVAILALGSACVSTTVSSTISSLSVTAKPCASAFQIILDDRNEMDSMNRTLSLIKEMYPLESFHSSISHHAFVRMAPVALQEEIARFVE